MRISHQTIKKRYTMRKVLFCLLMVASQVSITHGQDLWFFLQKTQENYPIGRNRAKIDSIIQLRIKNSQNTWFPQLNLVGQSTYQSDVTSLTLPAQFQGLAKPVDKDQHKIYLELSQMIYDGGIATNQKKVEQASGQAQLAQHTQSMHDLRSRVVGAYFAILLADANRKQLDALTNTLLKRLKDVESGVNSGTILKSSLSSIKAELLKVEQQKIEVTEARAYATDILSIISGVRTDSTNRFIAPDSIPSYNGAMPEIQAIDAEINRQAALYSLSSVKRHPQLVAFGQAGYGKPGLNMMGNSWDTYYLVGAKLSWNIWDWNKTRNEKRIISLNQSQLTNQKESALKNMAIRTAEQDANIAKLEQIIARDRQILAYREEITAATLATVKEGATREIDYITDLNSEFQALIEIEKHQLQMAQSKILKLILSGY